MLAGGERERRGEVQQRSRERQRCLCSGIAVKQLKLLVSNQRSWELAHCASDTEDKISSTLRKLQR